MLIPNELVIAAFGSLVAALVAVWRITISHHNTTRNDLDRSLEQHREDKEEAQRVRREDQEQIRNLTGEIRHLQGTREGYESGVNRISAAVLEEVRKLQREK